MVILALDSSTRVGSVALLSESGLEAEYTLSVQRTHAERLLPAVAQVLKDSVRTPASVDAVAVTRGPGSFTGIRIALATAKGLAYALGRPLVGISTLSALAYGVAGLGEYVCPLIDARRGEAYSALYRTLSTGGAERVSEYAALPVAELLERLGGLQGRIVFTGDGATLHNGLIRRVLGERAILPPEAVAALRGAWVAALGAARLAAGEADSPATLAPLYVRQAEAEVKWAAQHGKGGEPPWC